MLHSPLRPILACLIGATGASHFGCAPVVSGSSSLTTGTVGTGSSTTSGAGGAGGDSSVGGSLSLGAGGNSTGGATCVFPTPDDPGDYTGPPVQLWCEPASVNPPGCPLEKPLAGDACLAPGLGCAYDRTPEGFVLDTCGQSWGAIAYWCKGTCAPSASSVATPQQPACGALPDIQCSGGAGSTNQERADRTLEEISACCPLGSEQILVVWFADGCATAAAGAPETVSCINGLLAGRRLDCAKELSCATYVWSTLP